MSLTFNPLIYAGLDNTGSSGGGGGGSAFYKDPVPNFASLPLIGNSDGDVRLTLDTHQLYSWNSGTSSWVSIGGGSGLTLGNVGSSPNAQGATLISGTLALQPADSTNPGVVTILAQNFSGDKTFNNNLIVNNVLKLADSGNFFEQNYVDNISLAANVTSPTAISSLTFPFASYRSQLIDYSIEQNGNNAIRTGTLKISTNGVAVSLTDDYTNTSILGGVLELNFDVAINGSNVEVRYNNTNTTNTSIMRCFIRKFRS